MNQRRQCKILQITKAKFPPEIRVVKEGLSLHEADYTSAVLCPPYEGQSEYEIWNGIEIFRPKVLKRFFFEKLFEHVTLLSPAWYFAITGVIKSYQPDVLHIHDIWLGRVAFLSKTNQRVVFDLHENMPAAVVEYLKGYSGPLKLFFQIFQSHRRILRYEYAMLKRSDMILACVAEAKERVLLNYPKLDSYKVHNIENLESKRFISEPDAGEASFEKDHFSVLYIGGFGPHRGIDTLIRSMVNIKKRQLNVKVHLIGARPSQYLEMMQTLIASLGVENEVRITGWVPVEDVLANIRQADVCCVPHHSNPHTDNTIPHKLYQYMIAKRPVLVSSSAPLARTVRHSNAGLVFEAGDSESCANAIVELMQNPQLCLKLSNSGYRYVMEQGHNWEEESAPKLLQAYDELLLGCN